MKTSRGHGFNTDKHKVLNPILISIQYFTFKGGALDGIGSAGADFKSAVEPVLVSFSNQYVV